MKTSKLDKQIREIFKDFNVTSLQINKTFVEFTYQNENKSEAGMEIDFNVLQTLHKLLKPKKMQINVWADSNWHSCHKCKEEEYYGYVVAYL